MVPGVEGTAKGRAKHRAGAPAAALRELERIKADRGEVPAARKRKLLSALERAALGRPAEVERLHEALLFLRAYPDDSRLLRQVVRMLDGFSRRDDLARHRARLAGSGIAGTAIRYRFFAETAAWLAARFGSKLAVDWAELDDAEELTGLLPLLAAYAETPALDQLDLPLRSWVARMKRPDETDGGFLVRRFQALRMDSRAREAVYDRLDIPMVLAPGPGTPSRTGAHFRTGTTSYLPRRPDPALPDLAKESLRRPERIRELGLADAGKLVDLARGMMVTQQRDLDVFSYAEPRDARLVEWGSGLSFGFLGAIPERRLFFESLYGWVALQNGVPIGYGTAASLFGSSEVAFNVSPAFRGGGAAARVLARLLASVRTLFGADSFTLDPYQIGQDNEEAVASGAWWFYQKLGFRARDPKVLSRMERELRRMRARPEHRSSPATLRRLAAANVFFQLGRRREDVLGRIPLENVGLRVMDHLARDFGSRREAGVDACRAEASRLTETKVGTGWTGGERLAWERWSPLVALLPGVARWPRADRAALAGVIRAKGGRRESDFVSAFDAHPRLRAAVRTLARDPGSRRGSPK